MNTGWPLKPMGRSLHGKRRGFERNAGRCTRGRIIGGKSLRGAIHSLAFEKCTQSFKPGNPDKNDIHQF